MLFFDLQAYFFVLEVIDYEDKGFRLFIYGQTNLCHRNI